MRGMSPFRVLEILVVDLKASLGEHLEKGIPEVDSLGHARIGHVEDTGLG